MLERETVKIISVHMRVPDGDPMTVSKVLLLSMDDPTKGGGVGGKHTHLRLLAKGLQNLKVETETVSARETLAFRLFHRWPGALVRRFHTTQDKRYMHYEMQFAEQLRRNLRKSEFKADVCNPHDAMAATVLRENKRTSEIPIVLTLHGYYAREAASDGELTEGSPEYKTFQEIEEQAYQHASRIVCVDSRIRDYVVSFDGVAPQKVSVMANAVDTESFVPSSAEQKNAIRDRLGISHSAFVLLCPRRLVAKNGVSNAVLAMQTLLKGDPESLLVLAGNGPERQSLERLVRQANELEKVRFEGSVPHDRIRDYFAAADVIVIPSVPSAGVEEATSLSMLEGMACAKPILASSVGGLKETVRDGVTGLLIPPGDPAAIAETAHKLKADPELMTRLGNAAREYVVKNHSYLTHAQKMLAEYELAARTNNIGKP